MGTVAAGGGISVYPGLKPLAWMYAIIGFGACERRAWFCALTGSSGVRPPREAERGSLRPLPGEDLAAFGVLPLPARCEDAF